jgi:beta-phosphoglucomutase
MSKFECKALVFDMDGVLVDTSPSHAKAYEFLWNKLTIQGPDYSEIAGRSTVNVIEEYTNDLTTSEKKKAVAYKQSCALQLLETAEVGFDDTLDSLSRLKSFNLPMAVATSASRASSSLVLNNINASVYFKTIITGEDVENAKPAPDLFLKAIDYLGVDAENVVIIEDSQSGIEAALASGAWTISVRNPDVRPEVNSEEYSLATADHAHYLGHFDNLTDMTNFLLHGLDEKLI